MLVLASLQQRSDKKKPVGFIYRLSGPLHSKVLTIDVAGCVSSGIVNELMHSRGS